MANDPIICKTYDDVIRVLGGVTKIALATGRTKTAVSAWRRKGQRFPSKLYFKMRHMLEDRNAVAPRSLWGFEGEQFSAERDAA
jgi:hypothetical protein